MLRVAIAMAFGGVAMAGHAFAGLRYGQILVVQTEQASPLAPETPPAMRPPTALPPGAGAQSASGFGEPGAGAPAVPVFPGAPPDVGPRPVPRIPPEPPAPNRNATGPTTPSVSSNLIPFLDSTAPWVQAFDFILMLIAGMFCLRARKAPGLTIMAISCFISAIILLGFFAFGFLHGQGAFAQTAYIIARILAPFELLLFAMAIIVVARRNTSA